MDEYGPAADDLIARYRKEGESGLVAHALEFDGVSITENQIWVDPSAIKNSHKLLSSATRTALDRVKDRIERFHEELKITSFQREEDAGVVWGAEVHPLDRVGIYVPGGRANYFMALMLCAIPARVAGVKEIVVATPPKKNIAAPFIDPTLLYSAKIMDVHEIILGGGVMGMAAMAFGTKKTKAVEKIVGSGGKRTTVGKQRLLGYVGVDGFSGPSETAFVCDKSSNVKVIAADILARADSDPEAEIFVFHTREDFIQTLVEELAAGINQLKDQRTRGGVESCLEKNTYFFLIKNLPEAFSIINQISPGTVCLDLKNASDYSSEIRSCGSLLIGEFTPSPSMDLVGGASGPVNTLGSASHSVSISPASFVRRFGVIEYDQESLARYRKEAVHLAQDIGFTTHEQSYKARFQS
jgi:histidinol dehydrogenase